MTGCTLDSSVVDWVIEHPETLALFKSLGIDYSCGGKSLEYVCRQQGLEPRAVLSRLQKAIQQPKRAHGDRTTPGCAANDSGGPAGAR